MIVDEVHIESVSNRVEPMKPTSLKNDVTHSLVLEREMSPSVNVVYVLEIEFSAQHIG